ncbi:MAG: tetratricopeptide repeat protein [Aquificaceae bacterium]|nr:tetratricopeptide repeat protein [Aquificaceae bacterium]
MWKLTKLFSLFLLLTLAFSQQITREFDVKVELTGRLYEEKPKLSPPTSLPLSPARELNLTPMLLEAPKGMEFAQVKPLEKGGGVSCGEPKDALAYRLGVEHYLRGRYELAQEELGKVLLLPNSPFKPMAEYVLGIIAYSKKEGERALELFRSSCGFSHMYQKAACEAFYALHFTLRNSLPENQDGLWQAVKALKEGREVKPLCENAVFSQYCLYVSNFVEGKENLLYRDSTLLRSGVIHYFKEDFRKAKEVFLLYSTPGKPYREVALYYLALIEYKEGRGEQALKYASILETMSPRLAGELYAYLSEKDLYLSRLAYSLTKDTRFLEKAGVIAYNSGDYALAYRNFLEAGNLRYGVYSAVKMGDYKRVIQLLKEKKAKDKEDYLWLLEALYWSGEDLSGVLLETAKAFPEIHKEYSGWERFRKGNWLEALNFFEDPYYRSIALYNLRRYKEVISTLQGRGDQRSNLLKARSALMLGEPGLARSFLTDRSGEELYLLGLSYFLEGNYSKALSFFERVSGESPLVARALLRAGDSYYNMGNLARAKESYYQVLRRFPDSEEAKQATLALLDFGGKEIGEEEMEKLLLDYMAKEKSPSPEILYQYASLQARKGNRKEAERQFLKLLDTPLKFKAILKLAELEEEASKRLVLLYKVYKEAEGEEERNRAREELIKIYTLARDTKSLADLLAEGSKQDKVKAVGLYMSIKDFRSALAVAGELMKTGHRDQEFERYLLDLYRQTDETSLLEYLSNSPDRNLRGQAVYLQGREWIKKGEKRRALEKMVEVSMNYRGEPYHNKAVLEGAKILLEMGARRDASCMLDRFDLSRAEPEDISLHNALKQGLPKCEVR